MGLQPVKTNKKAELKYELGARQHHIQNKTAEAVRIRLSQPHPFKKAAIPHSLTGTKGRSLLQLPSLIRRVLLNVVSILCSTMGNLPRPNDIIHFNHEICTTETKVRFWNIGDVCTHDEFLDDDGLKAKLATLVG